jgi:hypothetical protein
MRRTPFFPVLALLALSACNQVRDGFAPVLGEDVTAAEKERYARRLYLDLTGLPATAEQTQAVVDRLDQEGNTAETRDAIAGELVSAPEMGSLYLGETENAALSGQSVEQAYTFLCAIVRGTDPACGSCAEADSCACQCPALVTLGAERQALRDLGADLVAGGPTRTSDFERAIAASGPFLFNGTSPDGIAMQLFEAFLARPAEADEIKNARFMTIGSLLPDSPAGLLFHRHGTNYADLLDIVFESEIYRDAMVSRVFQRYLGRRPSGDELRFFSASLDPAAPDMRPVVRAVVSSTEYFYQ